MKKLILSLIIICIGTIASNAQITGGGNDKSKKGSTVTNDVFSNYGYITFNRSYAIGDFGKEVNYLSGIVNGKGNMNKGLGINIGKLYYINSIDLIEELRFGIDWTIISWDFVYAHNNDDIDMFSTATNFFASKIGPTISYNPIDKLIIDGKLTIQPTLILMNQSFDNDSYLHGSAFKFRTGLSVNTRYKSFMLGFEMSFGKTNMELNNYDDLNGDTNVKTEIPTTRFDLVFGLAF